MKIYKMISFALCLILSTSALCVNPSAEEASKTVYTALGDSIAAGYALSSYTEDGCTPKEGYVSIFAEKLGTNEVNDLAVTGIDTDETLELLKTDPKYGEAVKRADVITVSLGSNDLLGPGIDMIIEAVTDGNAMSAEDVLAHFSSMELKDIMEAAKKISDHIEKPEQQERLNEIDLKFKENWTNFIDIIRELNPTADLIVTDYYNPYYILDVILKKDIVQPLLDKFNLYIREHEYNETKYKIANISELGTVIGLTNVNPLFGKIDVHPSEKGHDYIARRIWSVYSGEPFEDKTATDTQSVAPETTKVPTNTTVAATSGSSGKGCSGFPAVSVLAMVFIPTAVFFKRKQ